MPLYWVGVGSNERAVVASFIVCMEKLRCMRCQRRANDVDRAHFFFCAECAAVHERDAFRGTPPLFQMESMPGMCEYCDRRLAIAYRQWLLCSYCLRVVQSYRGGRLSAAFALAQLRRLVEPVAPQFTFEEADPVVIQATARRGRTRDLAKRLDIEAIRTADRTRAFWLELKTGPGSIDDMGVFQLDCSDCDDITNVVRTSGLPAFLVHCQMTKVPEPPTVRLVGHTLWWTDLDSFRSAFIEVKARRTEGRKMAAYFDPCCFRPIDTLGEFLVAGGLDGATGRLAADGCPALYKPA